MSKAAHPLALPLPPIDGDHTPSASLRCCPRVSWTVLLHQVTGVQQPYSMLYHEYAVMCACALDRCCSKLAGVMSCCLQACGPVVQRNITLSLSHKANGVTNNGEGLQQKCAGYRTAELQNCTQAVVTNC